MERQADAQLQTGSSRRSAVSEHCTQPWSNLHQDRPKSAMIASLVSTDNRRVNV